MSVHPFVTRIEALPLPRLHGVVRKVAAGHFEATGPACTVGDICEVVDGVRPVLAEVAAVDVDKVTLMPLECGGQLRPGAKVYASPLGGSTGVGPAFAGRAIDALGRPIDGGASVGIEAMVPLSGAVLRPLDRAGSTQPIETGVRAIDGLLTLSEGQRVGIFAASGVGKTSLLEQLVAQIACDRCVVCLVGERGREVEGFWNALSARDDADRFTIVAATSDESAALRARATDVALSLAEYWRDRGEHVLLVVDSVTRLAMALREIGLAAGEPPTLRAYTPNVFAALPRLVERCGARRGGGAITAIMTVLSETDDVDDPIVEVMKSLLDGHIVLSRTLAEKGHFPAIDVSRSVSRQAERVVATDHAKASRAAVAMLGTYDDARVMIESGMYQAGADAAIDRAIAARSRLMVFLKQGRTERVGFGKSIDALRDAMAGAHG